MRSLTGTNEWLEQTTGKVFIPPILYSEPSEGWHAWTSNLTGLDPTKPDTHSGNIVAAHAPAWAQWLALTQVLDAESAAALDGPKRELRERFDAGFPIPITPPNSIERYVGFVPLLRYDHGQQKYLVNGDTVLPDVTNHVEALRAAGQWLDRQKVAEVEAQRERASQIADTLPAFYVQMVTLQLEYDGILVTSRGDLVAMQNGPHGFYIVMANDWCYALASISPGVIAKMAIMSVQDDRAVLLTRFEDLPLFAGLDGWRGDGAGGYRWGGGRAHLLQPGRWRIEVNENPVAVVEVDQSGLQALGSRRRTLFHSQIPSSWALGVEPPLAWAVWRVLRLLKRK